MYEITQSYLPQVNAPCLNFNQTNLPTPKGWKAELTVVVGYGLRTKTVTHESTNRARHREPTFNQSIN